MKGGASLSQVKLLKSGRGRVLLGVIALAAIAVSLFLMTEQGEAQPEELTDAEVNAILAAAEAQANLEPSDLRRDEEGNPLTTKMHIAVVDREGKLLGLRSMDDAWVGSIDIAQAKAYTAVAFSSDENALTSRSIGCLSQPGASLWHIGNSNQSRDGGAGDIEAQGLIEFPGGIPLYKDGHLVGGIGVSGDGVEPDENVAEAGAVELGPDEAIRIDTVTEGAVPYIDPGDSGFPC
jgi:uncharacterized protein GlcG (DUF336 family)